MTDGLRGLVSILGESRFVGRGNRSQRCNALKTSRLTVRSYFLLIPPSYLYITYSVVQTSNTSNLGFCLNLTNFLHFPNRPLYNRKPETHRISKVRNELTRAPLKRLLPKRNSRSSIATTSPLLSISNVPLINRIESANGRHSSAPTCTVSWFSLSMLKKPWPHFNGDTVVISTITRYYAIVRNSRGPFSPSIGREISLSASWNAHEDQRYPGNRLRGKVVRGKYIASSMSRATSTPHRDTTLYSSRVCASRIPFERAKVDLLVVSNA